MDIERLRIGETLILGGYRGEAIRRFKLAIIESQPEIRAQHEKAKTKSHKSLAEDRDTLIARHFKAFSQAFEAYVAICDLDDPSAIQELGGIVREGTEEAAEYLAEIKPGSLLTKPAPFDRIPGEILAETEHFYSQEAA